MTFTYKYRDKSGGMKTGSVEAASRKDAFAKLAARNISPVNLKEGAGVPANEPKQSKPLIRGLAAGFIVVALAGVVAWQLGVFKQKPIPVTEQVVKKPAPKKPPRKVKTPKKMEPKVEAPKPVEKPVEKKLSFRDMTPEQRLDMQIKRAAETPLPAEPATNRAFRTGAEQLLSWVFQTTLGDMPPPLPQVSLYDEVHLEEILNSPNPVREGDSERTIEAKKIVEIAKKELKDYIAKGGDISGFLDYYRGILVQAAEEYSQARKDVMRVIREEPDIAEQFIEETNRVLGEKGIKPVMIPPRMREKLGLK